MIAEQLPFAIEGGEAEGAGLWEGPLLVGVAAWSVHPTEPGVWRCHTVAARTGHKRRGIGRRLKYEVLGRAKQAGARRVESAVHKENGPMLDLNLSLGAKLVADPESIDYFLCVIAI